VITVVGQGRAGNTGGTRDALQTSSWRCWSVRSFHRVSILTAHAVRRFDLIRVLFHVGLGSVGRVEARFSSLWSRDGAFLGRLSARRGPQIFFDSHTGPAIRGIRRHGRGTAHGPSFGPTRWRSQVFLCPHTGAVIRRIHLSSGFGLFLFRCLGRSKILFDTRSAIRSVGSVGVFLFAHRRGGWIRVGRRRRRGSRGGGGVAVRFHIFLFASPPGRIRIIIIIIGGRYIHILLLARRGRIRTRTRRGVCMFRSRFGTRRRFGIWFFGAGPTKRTPRRRRCRRRLSFSLLWWWLGSPCGAGRR